MLKRRSQGLFKRKLTRSSVKNIPLMETNNQKSKQIITENQSQTQTNKITDDPDKEKNLFRIKNQVQMKLEDIIGKNIPYFAHKNRACVCGICTCGKCKCNAPNNIQLSLSQVPACSDYKSNFLAKPRCPARSLKQNEPLFRHQTQNMLTIYKQDFLNPDQNSFKVCSSQIFENKQNVDKELASIKSPFPKISNYGENYLDFKNRQLKVSFRPSKVSNIDRRLPFYAKVSNKEYGNFTSDSIIPNEDGRKYAQSQYKNPIATETMLKEGSSTKDCYQPFLDLEKSKPILPRNEIYTSRLPTFKNQFKNSSSCYDGSQNSKCPGRVVLNGLRR